jgi:VanZ family protein
MIKKHLLSISVGLIIVLLSLISGEKMHHLSPVSFKGLDKIIHFIMYFTLMSVVIYENRKNKNSYTSILPAAIFPFLLGLFLELAQWAFTDTRSGSLFDLFFNISGILFSISLFILIRYFRQRRIR